MTNSNTFVSLVSLLNAHKAASTPDIKCVVDTANLKYGFSEQTLVAGENYGADFPAIFSLPQKQVKRAVQLINALATATYENLDYTHARILCAMKLAGSYDLNADAIIQLAAAKREGDANTRGISFTAISKMFSRVHSLDTVKSKVSNSIGKNGIYQSMGLTWGAPGERNHTVSLNNDHPMVARFFDLINKATTGQIEQLVGDAK